MDLGFTFLIYFLAHFLERVSDILSGGIKLDFQLLHSLLSLFGDPKSQKLEKLSLSISPLHVNRNTKHDQGFL